MYSIINLPNFFTMLRILSIPFLIIFFDCYYISRWIFLFAIITDSLDGIIARASNKKTKLGSILDPTADKLLLVTTFLLLAIYNVIPLWYAVVIISRDFFVFLGWLIIYIITSENTVSPTILGKLTNFTQATLAFLYLIGPLPKYSEIIQYYSYIMLALTIISGFDYIMKGSRKLI